VGGVLKRVVTRGETLSYGGERWREKGHHFLTNLLGFARSSFWSIGKVKVFRYKPGKAPGVPGG
jgi:hypothetical protein